MDEISGKNLPSQVTRQTRQKLGMGVSKGGSRMGGGRKTLGTYDCVLKSRTRPVPETRGWRSPPPSETGGGRDRAAPPTVRRPAHSWRRTPAHAEPQPPTADRWLALRSRYARA